MLTANVLCLKRRKKKKGEYILNLPSSILVNDGKTKGRKTGKMLHITEDTPADMLSGAMDLTIHLPTGKTVKMCAERRTPMMDLLVQITTNHQLQITNYTLQPLQTSSGENYPERVLSYYPNTPIGALDTQHIKVIPKTRTLPIAKNAPPVQQPFESTFRLKVHLPRNQLYVTRVSKHVHIGDIMRKVCEEKSLDPNKYEVRHPGNLDEILDPKLTLHDYMITEINLVVKGSNANRQTFTSDDIMTLKKEEERKSIPNKSGGVFNKLFRRGKSSNVTTAAPPPVKEPTIQIHKEEPLSMPKPLPPKTEIQIEKPKIPQRKRRPAPKPPQPAEMQPEQTEKDISPEPVQLRNGSVISDSSNVSENGGKHESGVTICHSRHSSDSSGYHETSILSDQCNTSLPRRNRMVEADTMGRLKLNRYSESTGNLTKMTSQSRSTSSLIFPGRKKKAAPPPPQPFQKPTSSTTNLESLSPVVASQTPLSTSSSKTGKSIHLEASSFCKSVVRGLEYGQGEKFIEMRTCKNKCPSKSKASYSEFLSRLSFSYFFPCTSSQRQDKFKGTVTLGKIYEETLNESTIREDLDEDNDDTLTVIGYPSDDEKHGDSRTYQIIVHRDPNHEDFVDIPFVSDTEIPLEEMYDDVFSNEEEIENESRYQMRRGTKGTSSSFSNDSLETTRTFSIEISEDDPKSKYKPYSLYLTYEREDLV